MSIAIPIAVIVTAIGAVLWGFRPAKREFLSAAPARLPMMGIQIVCGNCAGDGQRPRRTLMARDGNCEECGGHSYLLASGLRRPDRVEVAATVPVERRVLSFKLGVKTR